MRAKFGRDPMAGSKKVTLKFIIGLSSKQQIVFEFNFVVDWIKFCLEFTTCTLTYL